MRFHHSFFHHTPSSTIPTLGESKFASSTTVERAGVGFSDVNAPNNFNTHCCASNGAPNNQQEEDNTSQESDKIMAVLTNKLKDLDFVWRPMEISMGTSVNEESVYENLKELNHQLKQSSAFVKHVTRTLKKKLSTEPGDRAHCFTMMYDLRAYPAMIDNPAGDASEEDFEEFSSAQWTAVIAVVMDEEGNVKKNIMVLQAPDSACQLSRDSLVNVLDIVETLGCECIYVAVNKHMESATERIQITKAFMSVGFKMQHPRILAVDGHVLLGYDC